MNSRFIDRMILHWTNTLRLPSTNALIKGWSLLEEAIDAAAKQERWQVVPLPTGAGKTEALTVLLATPNVSEHPGALVITKFKCEADKIARSINTIAGSTIARAAHTDAKVAADDMATSQVLVLTHKAYTNALREAEDANVAFRLDRYHQYYQSTRKWLFIDEALDWVDAYEADIDDLSAMCGALSGKLPAETSEALRPLLALALSINNERNADRTDRPLSFEQIDMLQTADLEILESAIQQLPTDATEVWRNTKLVRRTKDEQQTTFKKQYLELAKQLQSIQRIGSAWLSHRGERTRLHSSRMLLDTKRMCGVILDATAGIDASYSLHGSNLSILPRPNGIRSYSNVTIHVSKNHRVGKEYLTNHACTEWPVVAAQIAMCVKPNSKVLAITHKDARKFIRRCDLECDAFEVAHWGDLDGKNDWKDFNTVVVYGLPYLDDIAPTNAFLATQAAQTTDWFYGQRQHGHRADMKAALKSDFIDRSVVQAINRSRSRTIIDDQGNCAPTDVFILLPSGAVADELTLAIQQEMPGATLVEWQADPQAGERLTPSERGLIALLSGSMDRVHTASQIIVQLSITKRTYERLSARLRKPRSKLTQELAAIGFKYERKSETRKEACFIKH